MLFKLLSLIVATMVGIGVHGVSTDTGTQGSMAIVQPSVVGSNVVLVESDVTLIPSGSTNFSRTKHEDQTSICINNRTREYYVGELVSREEVKHYASQFWSGWNLEVALAVSVAEGQRDLNCLGDDVAPYYGAPTSDGRHWGESVGLYQYRTVIEATGKGGCEDKGWQLGDIERQTRCAYEDKFVRSGWRPWT